MWRKILNPFMTWLLRSPLHFLVSGQIMLISVTGRKSGRTYTTPVDYRREDGVLLAITSQKYSWWKNLLGGGDARMVVAGREMAGRASVSQEAAVVLATLNKMYPGRSGIEQVAPGCVALKIVES